MPQNKPQTYIAAIEYLRSYGVIKKLIDSFFVVENFHFESTFLKELKNNNPSLHDLGMEDSFIFLKDELEFDILKIFDYFSNRHMIIDSGRIKICTSTLEEFFLLHSSIDTTPFETFYLLNYTEDLDHANRIRYIDAYFNMPPTFFGRFAKKIKKLSDNHIHLGGALDYEYRLHTILKSPSLIDTSKNPDDLFVQLTECHTTIKNIILIISTLETLILECLTSQKKMDEKEKSIHADLIKLLKSLQNNNEIDIKLLSRKYLYSIRDQRNHEMFFIAGKELSDMFLTRSMQYFQEESIVMGDRFLVLFLTMHLEKHHLKEPIEIYFILRNILKVYIVQQHRREGFGYFSSYSSGNTIRRSKLPLERKHIIHSLFNINVPLNIEGRITLQSNENALVDSMIGYIIPFEKLRFT